jgi:hypothetical protein
MHDHAADLSILVLQHQNNFDIGVNDLMANFSQLTNRRTQCDTHKPYQ